MSQASETQYVFCLIGELLSTSVITAWALITRAPSLAHWHTPPCVMYVVSLEAREEKNGQESVVSTVGADKNGTPVFVHFSAQAASISIISVAIM